MKDKLDKHQLMLEDVVAKITSGNFDNMPLESIFSSIEVSGKLWLLGAGKASVAMAKKAEQYFGDSIKDGIIIAPQKTDELTRVQVFKGTHPYPDEESVSASFELWDLAAKIPAEDTVLFCLSGGASSLFCIPAEGIELLEFREMYKLLLNSGASIHEINTVRKHLSTTAGGRLGKLLKHQKLISVLLSDVPGDNPEVIGSGPTVPDSSTFKEAFQILKRYRLWDQTPHAVRIYISKGMYEQSYETPKPKDCEWENHAVHVISGAKLLATNVAQYLEQQGLNVQLEEKAYDMDVKQISKKICSEAVGVLSTKSKLKKPAALIYFGESTVHVVGDGKGGRNQQLALNAAISIEGQHAISLLSFATDGVDGPTDASGAIINSQTTLLARKKKLVPEDYVQNNDAYHFHEAMDTILRTGPTGNNLMDIQVVLIG